MGSLLFGGVRFVVYANDHLPRHVHGFYAETDVIVSLLPGGDVGLANRKDRDTARQYKSIRREENSYEGR